MTHSRAKIQAQICADAMDEARFYPGSIISVGVGSAPEYPIWLRRFPRAKLLGIDPRGRRNWGDSPFLKAAVTDGAQKSVVWCGCCRSICCDRTIPHAKNRDHVVPCVTLDQVAADLPGPFFLWLDCEGSEHAALTGGAGMLAETPFLSVEVCHNGERIDRGLTALGYSVRVDQSAVTLDRLYYRHGWRR